MNAKQKNKIKPEEEEEGWLFYYSCAERFSFTGAKIGNKFIENESNRNEKESGMGG